MPVFFDLPGEEPYWTAERMRAVDFGHCDVCRTMRHRVRVFIVRRPDGSTFQAGGECAANLDLGRRLKSRLKAVYSFMSWLRGGEDGVEDYFGSEKGAGYLVGEVLALAGADIRERGYVSRRRSEETGEQSTKDAVSWLLHSTSPAAQKARRQVVKEAPLVRLRAEARAWVDKLLADPKADAAFANNLDVALQTGSPRLLGFLVYIPEGIRRAKADAQRAKAAAKLFPYDPEQWQPRVGADIARAMEMDEVDLEGLRDILGVKPGQLERALAKPDKALTKTLRSKLEKHLPGRWRVLRVNTSQGTYGVTTWVRLARSDGALVVWPASRSTVQITLGGVEYSASVEPGHIYWIGRAQVGKLGRQRVFRGVAQPRERYVKRVDLVPLDPYAMAGVTRQQVRRRVEYARRHQLVWEIATKLHDLASVPQVPRRLWPMRGYGVKFKVAPQEAARAFHEASARLERLGDLPYLVRNFNPTTRRVEGRPPALGEGATHGEIRDEIERMMTEFDPSAARRFNEWLQELHARVVS